MKISRLLIVVIIVVAVVYYISGSRGNSDIATMGQDAGSAVVSVVDQVADQSDVAPASTDSSAPKPAAPVTSTDATTPVVPSSTSVAPAPTTDASSMDTTSVTPVAPAPAASDSTDSTASVNTQ